MLPQQPESPIMAMTSQNRATGGSVAATLSSSRNRKVKANHTSAGRVLLSEATTTTTQAARKRTRNAVEIPLYEFMEVEVEKVVEVPQVVEKVIIHEIPTPQYVEKVYKVKNEIPITENIRRRVPFPLEHITTLCFTLPMIRPSFDEISVPLHIPRFVEVPMPVDLMSPSVAARCELLGDKVQALDKGGVSLCEIENIAATIRAMDFSNVAKLESMKQDVALMRSWDNGALKYRAQENDFALDNSEAMKYVPNQADSKTKIIAAAD